MAHDCLRVASAEEAFPAVELDFDDLPAQTGIPLSAKEINFGEFRHVSLYLLRARILQEETEVTERGTDFRIESLSNGKS